jgi:hypothetical protein
MLIFNKYGRLKFSDYATRYQPKAKLWESLQSAYRYLSLTHRNKLALKLQQDRSKYRLNDNLATDSKKKADFLKGGRNFAVCVKIRLPSRLPMTNKKRKKQRSSNLRFKKYWQIMTVANRYANLCSHFN